MPTFRHLVMLLFAAALVLAACGDDDEPVVAGGDGSDPVADNETGGDEGTADPATSGLAPDDDQPIPVEPDGGIGDSPFGSVPFFGANDDQCPSAVLTNDAGDEAALAATLDCFFSEYDAGNSVVVDVNVATVEGDPIFHRYLYDGATVLVVVDSRLDSFGAGTVDASLCDSITPGSFLPEVAGCTPVEHPGFPEAELG